MKQLSILLKGEFTAINLLTEIEDFGHQAVLNQEITSAYDCIVFSCKEEFAANYQPGFTGAILILNGRKIFLFKDLQESYLLASAENGAELSDEILAAITLLARDELMGGQLLPFVISEQVLAKNELSAADYQLQIFDWNATAADFPRDKTLTQLFEAQVARTPDNLALVYGDTQLSYFELNARANQLARYLHCNYQLAADDLVGLCLERSELMPLAILAVLKAGAAYLPMDLSYPDERISYLIEDAGLRVVLTNHSQVSRLSGLAGDATVLALDDLITQTLVAAEAEVNLDLVTSSHDLAYVIYTSGTTGKPKGVMLEQRGAVNLALMQSRLFELAELASAGQTAKNCLLYANYVFDAFVSEMFTVLVNGHCLHLINNDQRQDISALQDYILSQKISLATIPPALLLADNLLDLTHLVVAGEKAAKNILDKYLAHGVKVINAYGPTEVTVCSSLHYYAASDLNSSNIGRPLNNTTAYILDSQVQPLAIGEIGELYLGGIGLARGYLKRPDLTAERFIANPFQSAVDKAAGLNSRLYQTGDLARFLANGEIEYIGRNDFQVKIRGQRIELGEIESKLSLYPGIKQIVVLAHELKALADAEASNSAKYLAAFYVAENEIQQSSLQEYLASCLPDYMQPSVYLAIAKLPLTINGKVDRNSLLALLDSSAAKKAYDYSSYGEVEAYLANLWQELIITTTKKIELSDSFFGLGGHSLLVTRLILKLRQKFNAILTPQQIYTAASLAGLAELIRNALASGGESLAALSPAPRFYSAAADEYRLSKYQLSIYFAHLADKQAYTVPLLVRTKQQLDSQLAVQAFGLLFHKHKILNGAILQSENGLVHKLSVNPAYQPLVAEIGVAELDEYLAKIAAHEFDLATAVVDFRLIQVKDSPNCYSILSFTHHHLIADGYSIDLLLNEYSDFYSSLANNQQVAANDLEAYSYADVIDLITPLPAASSSTTREDLAGFIRSACPQNPHFSLAANCTRNTLLTNSSNNSGVETFFFNSTEKAQMRELAMQQNTTINAIMLSALYLALYRFSSEEYINLGVVFSNRENPFTEKLVGCLVNTLPLEIDFSNAATLSSANLIAEVAQRLNQYLQHSTCSLQDVLEVARATSDEKLTTLFNLVFASQYLDEDLADNSGFEAKPRLEKLRFEKLKVFGRRAKFDIAFNFYHGLDPERLELEFNLAKYSQDTILNFTKTLQVILGEMFAKLATPVSAVAVLSAADYQQQVYVWNQNSVAYPATKTITMLFEEQVLRTPNNIAVVYEGIALSYFELNARANQLAAYLRRSYQLQADDLVALCLDRSEQVIIALLAVFKTGAAYLPLDPAYPDQRIKYVLEDSKARLLLTNQGYFERLASKELIAMLAIDLPAQQDLFAAEATENLDIKINSHNLAYVIYTSGTTGRPKGVMIEHSGLVNLALLEASEFGLALLDDSREANSAGESSLLQKNCLQYANYVFDVHVWEIFTVLVHGHQLHILAANKRHDLDLVADYIQQNNIYMGTIPPALLNRDKLLQLQKLIVAGEKSDSLVMQEYAAHGVDLINAYGPTETTVCATVKHYSLSAASTNIGRPNANFTTYVLDSNLQPLPVGAIGELYIGGEGLARGYLHRPDLTSERFIVNPFQTQKEQAAGRNKRLYKTGDLVRYLANGDIDYIGRNDFQIKIRGFRIELGEIEAALNSYSLTSKVGSAPVSNLPIQQSVVLALSHNDVKGVATANKYLLAYYVATTRLVEADLFAHLSLLLPEYMLPLRLVQIDKIPLTLNGKLDKNALLIPELNLLHNYVAPQSEEEKRTCAVFAEVLGLEENKVGINDDFFKLGGSSITAIHLASKLNRLRAVNDLNQPLFKHKIRVDDIFSHKNIMDLVAWLTINCEEIPEIVIPRLNHPAAEIAAGNAIAANNAIAASNGVANNSGLLSFAQERLWFIESYEGGSNAYNTPLIYELNERTNLELLKKALISTIDRHEVLHSLIKGGNDSNQNYQIVIDLETLPVKIKQQDVASQDELNQLLNNEVNCAFKLSSEYPIRVAIYNLTTPNPKTYLAILIHHIAFDGWSMDILMRDLHANYRYFEQLAAGAVTLNSASNSALAPLSIQYKDFAAWQRSYLSGSRLEQQLEYWRSRLGDYVGLNLTTDYPRPSHFSYAGDDVFFAIDEKTSLQLRALAGEIGVSLYTVMLSGFYLFLRSYSNQNDIVIGSPVANRNYTQIEDLIGFFVNSLALRSKIEVSLTLRDYILLLATDVIEAQRHQDLPFERLINDLQIAKDQSRHPLFQVMFGVQSFGSSSNAKTKPIMSLFNQYEEYNHREFGLYDGYKAAKLDLTVMINDAQPQLFGSFNYATSLYSRATIEGFIETYLTVLQQFVAKIDQPLKHIEYLNAKNYQLLVCDLNATTSDYPAEKTLHQLFEEQAVRTPDNLAVVSGDVQLSYREFNQQANQLAHYLVANHAIVADDMIMLCLERSQYMLLAVQGTLKAGAAYVPIDPSYPAERKSYIASDTTAKVVLTTTKFVTELSGLLVSCGSHAQILALDDLALQQKIAEYPTTNPNTPMTSRNLAYVIYTSGTTGNPKGVMLEHRGVVNRIIWMNGEYRLTSADRILQKTPYVFDVSVWELFWAHCYGAAIVFAKPEGHKDSNYLIELMKGSGITVSHFVPSMLSVFEDTLEVEIEQGREVAGNPIPSLRYIFCSGEALNLAQAQKCHKLLPQTELHNLYGPTEASVDVLYYDCSQPDLAAVYIGKPVANTSAYVVDANLHPLPIGAVGELLIGGVQLARGYLNLPEMTTSKFIANPFQTEKMTGGHERLYRTGDLARILADGNIEYIGRNDFQIKIRGFRVELGEIETAIGSFAEVKSVVVLALEHKNADGKISGSKYLVAYYVADRMLDEEAMLNSLALQLPEYMLPTALVHLSILPVTINGKLDRKALPEPVFKASKSYVAPRDELEQQVCAIYAEVLGLAAAQISIYDDFFKLGGDSILAITLVSRLRQRLNLTSSVKDIFSYKNVAKLTEKVLLPAKTGQTKAAVSLTESGELTGSVALLPIQEWFFERIKRGLFRKPNHWNISFLLRVPPLDFEVLEHCLKKLIEYQDTLRLGYSLAEDGNYQQAYRPVAALRPLTIKRLDCSNLSSEELEAQMTAWQSTLDLLAPEVNFSVGYIQGYADGSCRLHFALHHLFSGIVSWRIINSELKTLYSKFSSAKINGNLEQLVAQSGEELLGAKGSSYRQWVQVLSRYEELYPTERSYWQSQIAAMLSHRKAVNELLLRLNDSAATSTNNARSSGQFNLDKATTGLLLTKSNLAYNTEINDILLSALGLALAKFSGDSLNYITLEGHGREEIGNIDLSHTVGWCTSLYPVGLEVAANDLSGTIVGIKNFLRAIPNKGIGFGALFGYIQNELPRISFNYLGQFDIGNDCGFWKIAVGEKCGTAMHSDNIDTNVFNINCIIRHGEFIFNVTSLLAEQQVAVFTHEFKNQLIDLIFHTAYLGRNYLSNSDVDFIISQEYLNKLQAKKDIEGVYLANSLQQGFIYHMLSKGNSDTAYRVQLVFNYANPLQVELLREAWQSAIKRFGALRLRFAWDEEIVQIIDKNQQLDWNYFDLSSTPDAAQTLNLQIAIDRARAYDLAAGQLLRIYLFKLGENNYSCLMSSHHAILDGWSTPCLLNYVHDLYLKELNLTSDETLRLLESVIAHDMYKSAQHYLQLHRHESEAYWQDKIKQVSEFPDLSCLLRKEHATTVLAEYRSIQERCEEEFILERSSVLKLRAQSQLHGLTLNAFLQYIWHKVLNVYGNVATTVVGTTISGRNLPLDGIEEAIGLYINTLPLIVEHVSQQTILMALEAVQQGVNELNIHSGFNLAKLQQNGKGLFDSLFVYENYPSPAKDENSLIQCSFQMAIEELDYPLAVIAYEKDEQIHFKLKYAGELFSPESIRKLLGLCELLLNDILSSEDIATRKVAELSYLSAAERQQIVQDWNATTSDYPAEKTLHQLFEEQAVRTPDNLAVVSGDVELSYREFNQQANQLAHYLVANHAIIADDMIMLCLERSQYMLLAVQGTLKAGAAYVPMDPSYPAERKSYIASDTKAKVVLTTTKFVTELSGLLAACASPAQILALDDLALQQKIAEYPTTNPNTPMTSRNLAYVIYTSGTTGNPKGVMLEHRGVVNRIIWMNGEYPLTSVDRILQKTPYVFDVSVWELFWAHCYGAAIVFAKPEGHKDSNYLIELMKGSGITVSHFVPSMLSVFEDTLEVEVEQGREVAGNPIPSLRYIFCSGEALNLAQVHKCHKLLPQTELHNLYGPTEASVDVLYYDCSQPDLAAVYIGKPVSNTSAYVVDANLHPLPIGAVGELLIGGVQLARGYLNLPEMTTSKFIANPFQTEKMTGGHERLYRTGDLARILADGNIEYIGRNDFQIKIRGFRVELGEIETALHKIAGIKSAVVLALEHKDADGRGNGNKYLVGYYVADTPLDHENILASLSLQLPEYMLPTALLHLSVLPVTINGKLDRKALPEPGFKASDSYIAPRTKFEQHVCAIYGEVLGVDSAIVGIEDDFFKLGGNSILAIRLVNRLNAKIFSSSKISLALIFKHKTIQSLLAATINQDIAQLAIPRLSPAVNNEYALSFAQERLWFIDKYEGGSNAYNTLMVYELNSAVDFAALECAIEQSIQRHEILHSLIKTNQAGQGYQVIDELTSGRFALVRQNAANFAELKHQIGKMVNHIYDLANEYPIQVSLHHLGVAGIEQNYITFVVHHIAFDGWSMDVFLRDLQQYYRYDLELAKDKLTNVSTAHVSLPQLPIQYKDFASWQKERLSGDYLAGQLGYWRTKLAGYSGLNLACDYLRPAQIDYRGDDVYFNLEAALSQTLRELGKKLGVSLYSVLLSGFYLFLRAYSGQDDIVVGSPIANRNYPELENLVGFFVNSLALRSKIDSSCSLANYIASVGADANEAQLYQDLPFEKLVNDLAVEKNSSCHPLFQVMFGLQSFGNLQRENDGYALFMPYQTSHYEKLGIADNYKIAKFDLSLFLNDNGEAIRGSFNYATSLFTRSSIERFIESYLLILEQFSLKQDKPIAELNLLSAAAYQEQIYSWNETTYPYPRDKNLVALFEEQVLRTPDHIAVVYENVRLSYQELNIRANQLGGYLRDNYFLRHDDLVALCLDRSEQMLIAILAVLKAGAAYVPLDPAYPDDRLNYALSDSQARVLLTNQGHFSRLVAIAAAANSSTSGGDSSSKNANGEITALNKAVTLVIAIDSPVSQELFTKQFVGNVNTDISSRDLAYVIYTSGTTGKPKGVMIEHRSVVNLALLEGRELGLLDEAKVAKNCLQYANYVFDAHVWEIFAVLFHGHQLHVLAADKRQDLDLLAAYIEEQRIYMATIPPALLSHAKILKLQKLIVAGEKTDSLVMQEYHAQQIEVINAYGPTEITVCATFKHYRADSPATNIGRANSNYSCYILAANLQPLPVGAVGELYIGGEGLARGYLNRPELTAERFIRNPFQTEAEAAVGRNSHIYKSGDLVRYLENGEIDYCGRNDFQVKLRGFRVELGEIEAAISHYQLSRAEEVIYPIQQSVVILREHQNQNNLSNGNKYLAAYFVAEEKIDETDLLAQLQARLPQYMLPQYVLQIDKVPLTINGKLDKNSLPLPELNTKGNYLAPTNAMEKLLCEIIAEVLGLAVASIRIEDDFFHLGGDSILAIQFVSRLRQQSGLMLAIKDIFNYKNIAALSSHLAKQQPAGLHPAGLQPTGSAGNLTYEKGQLRGEVPFLPIQKWFFNQLQNGSFAKPGHWNQSFLIQVEPLDLGVFSLCILKLIEYHDALRFGYQLNSAGEYLQSYRSVAELEGIEIRELDRSGLTDAEYQDVLSRWQSDFDLFAPNALFRIGYISGFADGQDRVFFACHHLLIATIGWRIIANDLQVLYNKLTALRETLGSVELHKLDAEELLGAKATSYRQWVNAVTDYGKQDSPQIQTEKANWEKLLLEVKPANLNLLQLFGSDDKPSLATAHVASKAMLQTSFSLSKDTSTALLSRANIPYHTQINDLLLSAFALALAKLSGRSTNYITLEGHGQEEIATNLDISHTLGWFTTMYPLALSVKSCDLGATILAVKQNLANIANNGLGFGALIGYDNIELPRISFNYLGQFSVSSSAWNIAAEASGLAMHPANVNSNCLEVVGFVINGKLHFDLNGKTDLPTLQQLALDFEAELNFLVAALLEIKQKHYLLNDFAADFSEAYTIIENKQQKNLFILPPGDGGYESYLGSLTPQLKNARLILFNNYYNHLCSKINMQNEVNNIDFSFLAKFYIQHIKQIQPEGPYNLFGWSFGGVLSFEISRQLESSGDQVSFLGMVDSFFDYSLVFNTLGIKEDVFSNDINLKYKSENFYSNQSNAQIVFFKAEQHLSSKELNALALDQNEPQQVFSHYVNSAYNCIERYLDVEQLQVIKLAASHYNWITNPEALANVAEVLDA